MGQGAWQPRGQQLAGSGRLPARGCTCELTAMRAVWRSIAVALGSRGWFGKLLCLHYNWGGLGRWSAPLPLAAVLRGGARGLNREDGF